MVGMLGCGCCGTVELCAERLWNSEISEDFSPTFDPYFSIPTGDVISLKTINGTCQCIGPENLGYATTGYEFGKFQKTTLLAPIEASLKLVFWDDEIYQGPAQPLMPPIEVKVVINITGRQIYQPLIVGTYTAFARAAFFNSTDYIFIVGDFSVRLNIRPKAGDVFGIRLSEFILDTTRPWASYITPSKAEFILNGQSIYTVTDSQYFTQFNGCQFESGFQIFEPAFIYPIFVLPNRVRVDDFTFSAL